MKTGGGYMTFFNILVGSSLFVREKVDRSLFALIQGKDIVLIGNGNTLSTKSFRLQDDMIQKLEKSGAKKVIYVELNTKNMTVLKKTDILYLMAGDERELLQLYENTLFRTLIKKHLKKGIIVAEQEAAIFLAKDVTWYLKNFCEMKDLSGKGLGIVAENFYMHYQPENQKLEEKLQNIEREQQIEIKRLTDQECYFTSSIENEKR